MLMIMMIHFQVGGLRKIWAVQSCLCEESDQILLALLYPESKT